LRENAIAAKIDPLFQVLDEQESEFIKEEAIRETVRALNEESHSALELLVSLRIFDLQAEMELMLGKRGTLYQLFTYLAEPGEMIDRWEAGLEEMRTALWNQQMREEALLADAINSLSSIPITDPQDRLAGSVLNAQQGCQALKQADLIRAANLWLQIDLRGGRQASWGGKDELAELKQSLRMIRVAAQTLERAGALQEVGTLDAQAAQHLHLWRALWRQLEKTYSQIKEGQQTLDFDDLELLTDRLLYKSPRSERLNGFLESINHLMVDEFQDTNLIQQRIVHALAPLDQPGKLFVVGDAKQSIYRFRQAQVRIFNQTAAQVKRITGYPPVPLSTSFRTHQSLVNAANSLFENILAPQGESHADYEAQPGPLRAHREAHPNLPSPLELLLLPPKNRDDEKISAEDARILEAGWIAQRLLELKQTGFQVWDKHQGQYRAFEYRDAALLFRATTQLPLYEAEFKRAGLPYLTVSGRGYYDRPEVQDLITLLGALANPVDDLNLAAVLRSPLFSFSDETLYRLRWHTIDGERASEPISYWSALTHPPKNDQPALVERADRVLSELQSLADRVEVWTLLRKALDLTSYEATLVKLDGSTGRQYANLQKFLALARDRGHVSLSGFLRRLRDLKAREAREGEALGKEPGGGAVQLMSIHASKGLEFPVVVVADMGRQKRAGFGSPYLLHDPAFGVLCKVRDELGDWQKPAGYAWAEWLHERMEEAERRRLLYVACTRAADLLILSGQTAKKNIWLSEVQEFWGIEDDGPQEETKDFADFSIKVLRPVESPDFGNREAEEMPQGPAVHQIPLLAQPVPPQPQPSSIAVTHLRQFLSRQADTPAEFRPAMWSHERPTPRKRAPNYLVGNIVHRVLANWDCLEYPANQLYQLLGNYARREGVFPDALADAVQRSHRMLVILKKHDLYQRICQAPQKFHEVPFTKASPTGILHGVIDLLIQDQDGGWHLLDWKTEWTPASKLEANIQDHLLQMAVYAHAAQSSLNIQPTVALCFLSPNVTLHLFSPESLANAWAEVDTN
jgi:ATP-dependent helicase/nuclease subunit A